MAEIKREAKMFMVTYVCDKCGEGEMVLQRNKPVLMSNPPQYSHECDKCGDVQRLNKAYPYPDIH